MWQAQGLMLTARASVVDPDPLGSAYRDAGNGHYLSMEPIGRGCDARQVGPVPTPSGTLQFCTG